MKQNNKGIILSDPKERFIEIDRKYLFPGKVISMDDTKNYIDEDIKENEKSILEKLKNDVSKLVLKLKNK